MQTIIIVCIFIVNFLETEKRQVSCPGSVNTALKPEMEVVKSQESSHTYTSNKDLQCKIMFNNGTPSYTHQDQFSWSSCNSHVQERKQRKKKRRRRRIVSCPIKPIKATRLEKMDSYLELHGLLSS